MTISKFGIAALIAASASLTVQSGSTNAAVYITEFCSNTGESVEFTNFGTAPVNMNGWSQDDSTHTPNKSGHVLSSYGTIQPGESVIFTEITPDQFRQYWWGSIAAAPTGLKIIGPYSNDNLSSSGDEVNLYDNTFIGSAVTSAYTDRLTYGAPNGGPASGVTRNGPLAVLGLNQNINWVDSFIGDSFGSFPAAIPGSTLIGNPGSYNVVPEPASAGILLLAGGLVAARRRRA